MCNSGNTIENLSNKISKIEYKLNFFYLEKVIVYGKNWKMAIFIFALKRYCLEKNHAFDSIYSIFYLQLPEII